MYLFPSILLTFSFIALTFIVLIASAHNALFHVLACDMAFGPTFSIYLTLYTCLHAEDN